MLSRNSASSAQHWVEIVDCDPPPSASLYSEAVYRQLVSSGGLPAEWFQWFIWGV